MYKRQPENSAAERIAAVRWHRGQEVLHDGQPLELAGQLEGADQPQPGPAERRRSGDVLPLAGVHPNLARRIGNELVALCDEGMTILMVEHELAIMDEFCDPVAVMAEGAVLAEGTMAQLRGRSEVVEAYLVG